MKVIELPKPITIRLTDNQALKCYHHNKEIRISRNGMALYVRKEYSGLYAYDWMGYKYVNIKFVSYLIDDDDFEQEKPEPIDWTAYYNSL